MDYSLSETCMLSTVRVTMLDDHEREIGSATAFHFIFATDENRGIPVLVTNKHVVCGCSKVRVVYTIKGPPKTAVPQSLHVRKRFFTQILRLI